jgi:hypothetical protein
MNVAASIVDFDAAERAACRIVLAYELGDALADFSEDRPEFYAAALSVAQIVVAFGLLQIPVTEKEAVDEFRRAFRVVKRRMKQLGKDAKLSEVLTEMHLDQRR